MNKRVLRSIKSLVIVSSPAIIAALMVLSLLSGNVGGGTPLGGFSDDTPSDGLIGAGGGPPGVRDTIPAIGINLWTDTADTLNSVTVEVTDVLTANFDPTLDLQNVYLYMDAPSSTNGVWDPLLDPQIGSGGGWAGGPTTWSATITPGVPAQIPVDDSWENEGSDFFIVVQSGPFINDLDDFNVGIPNGGIDTSSGALAFTPFTT
ncbi:MAG: hypothetical protein JSV09_14085, partial [Thermoplasmata archaeon]